MNWLYIVCIDTVLEVCTLMQRPEEGSNPMKIIKSFPVAAVALIVGAGSAFVLSAPSSMAQVTAEERSACMGDAKKFCNSDIPHVSKVVACLKANKSTLAPACQAEFEKNSKTKIHSSHFK
jgi:hypothetical protein